MMQSPFSIRIYDWDFVLSDVDRHQVENLIWLAGATWQEQIDSVKFEVVEIHGGEFGDGFQAKCRAKLSSGKVLETITLSAAKHRLLARFGPQLRKDLHRRLRYESGIAFRFLRWVGNQLDRLTNVAVSNRRWKRLLRLRA